MNRIEVNVVSQKSDIIAVYAVCVTENRVINDILTLHLIF